MRRGPHNGPQFQGWLCLPPYVSLVQNGAREPRKSGQKHHHSSGLDDSDSTSHSLLLCVLLNVCVPEHVSCQCTRLSAVHAVCTCTHRMSPLCALVSICRPVSSLSLQDTMTSRVSDTLIMLTADASHMFKGTVLNILYFESWEFMQQPFDVSTIIIPTLLMKPRLREATLLSKVTQPGNNVIFRCQSQLNTYAFLLAL